MSPRRASRISLVFAVMIIVCSARVAQADDKQEARASFERGVAASREARWEEARAQFKRSLELLPKASTIYNLVVADIKLGLGREALEQLDAFEEAANPEEHALMLERARVLRPQAQALVQSEQFKAQNGGNALSEADDGLTDDVRSEVERAREHYANGRDREALTAFEHAYRTSKRPQLLYNIGVVADRMRSDVRAIRAYEAFIAALPDAPEAAVAQVRSEALREALLAREDEGSANDYRPSPAVPDAGPRIDSAPVSPPDLTAPRALIVTGSLLIATAGGALGWYLDRANAYDACSNSSACTNLPTVQLQRNAALAVTITSAALSVGALTAGAVMLRKRKQAARRSAFAPWFSPSAAGMSFQRSF